MVLCAEFSAKSVVFVAGIGFVSLLRCRRESLVSRRYWNLGSGTVVIEIHCSYLPSSVDMDEGTFFRGVARVALYRTPVAVTGRNYRKNDAKTSAAIV
jgi:hypothetical protein